MNEKTNTLELTEREMRSLVDAAEVAVKSGKLMEVFHSFEDDKALITAMVKLKKALKP